jgi:thiamine biosynthesis protein ThiS
LRVYVNGEARDLPEQVSLQGLIDLLGFAVQRVAAELNGIVVRRDQWAATLLHEDDKIEIVHFVGGGSATKRHTSLKN